MEIKIGDLKVFLLKVLVLLMPFHVLIFNFFPVKVLSLWRDLLLLILLALTFLYRKTINKQSAFLIIRFLLCTFFAFIFHDSEMSPSIWLNVLRIYLFPSIIFFVIVNMKIKETAKEEIARMYVFSSFFISLFGIYQLFFLRGSFLKIIGVSQASVLLADGTQRNIGVFESANVMAIVVLFSIVLVYECNNLIQNKVFEKILKGVLLISLLLTYSMAGILSLICYFFVRALRIKIITRKTIKRILYIAVLFLALMLFIQTSNNGHVIQFRNQMNEKFLDIVLTVNGLNTISNSSANIHYNDLIDGIRQLGKNINGLGFAKESFMVSDKVFYRRLNGIRESSFLTIFYDFGLLIGVVYILPLFFSISTIIRRKNNNCSWIPLYITMIISISYIFLPLIQSYEISFFVFCFTALFISDRNAGNG